MRLPAADLNYIILLAAAGEKLHHVPCWKKPVTKHPEPNKISSWAIWLTLKWEIWLQTSANVAQNDSIYAGSTALWGTWGESCIIHLLTSNGCFWHLIRKNWKCEIVWLIFSSIYWKSVITEWWLCASAHNGAHHGFTVNSVTGRKLWHLKINPTNQTSLFSWCCTCLRYCLQKKGDLMVHVIMYLSLWSWCTSICVFVNLRAFFCDVDVFKRPLLSFKRQQPRQKAKLEISDWLHLCVGYMTAASVLSQVNI